MRKYLESYKDEKTEQEYFNVVFEIEDATFCADVNGKTLFAPYSQFEYVGHRFDREKGLFFVSLRATTSESSSLPVGFNLETYVLGKGNLVHERKRPSGNLHREASNILNSVNRRSYTKFKEVEKTCAAQMQSGLNLANFEKLIELAESLCFLLGTMLIVPGSLSPYFSGQGLLSDVVDKIDLTQMGGRSADLQNAIREANTYLLLLGEKLFELRSIDGYAALYLKCLYVREELDPKLTGDLVWLLKEAKLRGDPSWVDRLILLLLVFRIPEGCEEICKKSLNRLQGLEERKERPLPTGEEIKRVLGVRSNLEIDEALAKALSQIGDSGKAFDEAERELSKLEDFDKICHWIGEMSRVLDFMLFENDEEKEQRYLDRMKTCLGALQLTGIEEYASIYAQCAHLLAST